MVTDHCLIRDTIYVRMKKGYLDFPNQKPSNDL